MLRDSTLTIALVMVLATGATAQDFFERAREAAKQDSVRTRASYQGRERFDLALSADFPTAAPQGDRGSGRIGVSAMVDSDFACGRFDVAASLRSLFSKNAREEFLGSVMGAIESELLRNALVLACEASPTLCQALQHYRISANAMLAMNYDRCRAVEQALGDALEKDRAGAIKACVEEKRKAGLPLDEALQACRAADRLRSLSGERVVDLDLIRELRGALNLTKEEETTLQNLIGDRIKYTARGGTGEIAKGAVEKEYRRVREKYEKSWLETLDKSSKGEKPTPECLAKLVPTGSPGVSPIEFAEISLLRPALRGVVIASLASQSALLELVRTVHEVERNIEAARKLPTAGEGLIRKLERERDDLRAEIARLSETHDRQNQLNRTLLEGLTVARQNTASNATSALNQFVLDERRFRVEEDTQKWGGGGPRASKGAQGGTAGPGCGDCGTTTWGFGTAGGRK